MFANPKFTFEQMVEIALGISDNISLENIKIYAKAEYTEDQMALIRVGFRKGFSKEQIELYTDPEFNREQMLQILKGLEHGLTTRQVKFYADLKFDKNQMKQIRMGFERKLPIEQIQSFADPALCAKDMERCIDLINKGEKFSRNYVEAMKRYKKGNSEEKVALFAEAARDGVPLYKLDIIANRHFSEEQIRFLINNMNRNEANVSKIKNQYKSKKGLDI